MKVLNTFDSVLLEKYSGKTIWPGLFLYKKIVHFFVFKKKWTKKKTFRLLKYKLKSFLIIVHLHRWQHPTNGDWTVEFTSARSSCLLNARATWNHAKVTMAAATTKLELESRAVTTTNENQMKLARCFTKLSTERSCFFEEQMALPIESKFQISKTVCRDRIQVLIEPAISSDEKSFSYLERHFQIKIWFCYCRLMPNTWLVPQTKSKHFNVHQSKWIERRIDFHLKLSRSST